MIYRDPHLHQDRAIRAGARPLRRDAGTFDVEFHVDGCDCLHCGGAGLVEPRLDANDIAGIAAAGFVMGIGFALLLAVAGHPTATVAALLAVVGIGL